MLVPVDRKFNIAVNRVVDGAKRSIDSKQREFRMSAAVSAEEIYDRSLAKLLARLTKVWHTLILATEGLDIHNLSADEESDLNRALLAHIHADVLPHYRDSFRLQTVEAEVPVLSLTH